MSFIVIDISEPPSADECETLDEARAVFNEHVRRYRELGLNENPDCIVLAQVLKRF
jgi:predicted ATPase